MNLKTILLAGFVAAIITFSAMAAGWWPLSPQVGVAANTQGTSQVPAGETNLSGIETIPMDTNLPAGQNPQSQVVSVASLRQGVVSTNTIASTGTLANADAYKAFFTILRLTGAPSSGQTFTTGTATAVEALIPNVAVGYTWIWKVVNVGGTSSGVMTIGAGSGFTLTGNATVAVASSRTFYCTVTSVTSPAITCLDEGN